jgi:hypothetical protein
VGGGAAHQMWCGAILRYFSLPPYPEFVHTTCLPRALWSFKGTLNVVWANAVFATDLPLPLGPSDT